MISPPSQGSLSQELLHSLSYGSLKSPISRFSSSNSSKYFLSSSILYVINRPPEPRIVRLERWKERELFLDGLDEGF